MDLKVFKLVSNNIYYSHLKLTKMFHRFKYSVINKSK